MRAHINTQKVLELERHKKLASEYRQQLEVARTKIAAAVEREREQTKEVQAQKKRLEQVGKW